MTTLRVPIVASTYAQAQLVARERGIKDGGWIFVHELSRIHGLERGTTVLEAMPVLNYTADYHRLKVELGLRDINVETVWT